MADETDVVEKVARAIDYTPMPDGDPLGVVIANELRDAYGIETDAEIRSTLDSIMQAAARAAIAAYEAHATTERLARQGEAMAELREILGR